VTAKEDMFKMKEQQRDTDRPLTFAKALSSLAPLESFDPEAFDGGGDIALQRVCDLVAALALAWNDYKGNFLVYSLLAELDSTIPHGTTAQRLEYEGLEQQLVRMQSATLHELLRLIGKNREPITHPLFVEIVRSIPAKQRNAWKSLVDAAENKPASGTTEELLALVRNKVSFHYDAERIGAGLRKYFSDPDLKDRAFLSRGGSALERRFHFADAAARGYLMTILPGGPSLGGFFGDLLTYFSRLNSTLAIIVQRFVEKRGFAWRRVRSEGRLDSDTSRTK
jgi:hypothetical protein